MRTGIDHGLLKGRNDQNDRWLDEWPVWWGGGDQSLTVRSRTHGREASGWWECKQLLKESYWEGSSTWRRWWVQGKSFLLFFLKKEVIIIGYIKISWCGVCWGHNCQDNSSDSWVSKVGGSPRTPPHRAVVPKVRAGHVLSLVLEGRSAKELRVNNFTATWQTSSIYWTMKILGLVDFVFHFPRTSFLHWSKTHLN